jgi:hypothetical protein
MPCIDTLVNTQHDTDSLGDPISRSSIKRMMSRGASAWRSRHSRHVRI